MRLIRRSTVLAGVLAFSGLLAPGGDSTARAQGFGYGGTGSSFGLAIGGGSGPGGFYGDSFNLQFGYASAMSVALLVVLSAITVLQYRLTRAGQSDLG